MTFWPHLRRCAAPALFVSLTVAACGGTTAATAKPSPAVSPGTPAATPSPPATASSGPATASSGPATQRPAPVESNPPGDIPDNVAYIAYRNAGGRYTFVYPEGWASVARGPSVTFTDKLNGITATAAATPAAPTVASARREIAGLPATQPAFELRSVKPVTLPGGAGVLIVFRRNSAPDQVTGKVFRDEVQRYEIYHMGRAVTLDLFGAVGSDNVDPYTKISQSLRLS